MLVGVALGVAIGAVQWVPGVDAVATSQRAAHSVALFDSGSLPVRWLLLSIVPNLLGGTGSFGQPTFFGSYSLAEVTGYVGLMPLVGAVALLGRLRLRARLPEWVIWHAVGLVGVLLALGGNTVLGPVLMHLPLFGDQRLQSRNIMITDLALSVLLAYWADLWLRGARTARRRFPSTRQLVGSAGGVGAVAVVVATWAWGAGMLRWLGLSSAMADHAGAAAPWLVPSFLLGLGAIALVLWGPRIGRRRRTRLLVAFVLVDVTVFTLLTQTSVAPGFLGSHPARATAAGTSSAPGPARAATTVEPLSDLVHGGRFAIYDPDQIDGSQLVALGGSDGNVLTGTPSVEGYSSIVDSTYAQVTGSHQSTGAGQNVLDPRVIGDGTLDDLDTTVLVTPSAYLLTPVETGAAPTTVTTGGRRLASGQSASWYFGTTLDVTSVTIPLDGAVTRDDAGIRVGLVGESGSTRWETATASSGDGVHIAVPIPRDVVEVRVVAGGSSVDLGPPVMATVGGAQYRADGQLQDVLVPPRWQFRQLDGAFAVFDDVMARPALSLRASPNRPSAGASARATSGPAFAPTGARVSSVAGITVVRAVAAIPGSRATWRPAGRGSSQVLPIRRSGVVQAVTVPAGRGTITWSYNPPGARLGLWLSGVSLVLLVLMGLGALLWRRRPSTAVAEDVAGGPVFMAAAVGPDRTGAPLVAARDAEP
jgi:hypothetical protein